MIKTQKVSPLEFWELTPNEAALFLDELEETQTGMAKKAGMLTDEEHERLEKRTAQLRAKGVNIL